MAQLDRPRPLKTRKSDSDRRLVEPDTDDHGGYRAMCSMGRRGSAETTGVDAAGSAVASGLLHRLNYPIVSTVLMENRTRPGR